MKGKQYNPENYSYFQMLDQEISKYRILRPNIALAPYFYIILKY